MPKTNKELNSNGASGLEALRKFDIVAYRKFMKKNSKFLYDQFIKLSNDEQMLAMCTTIIKRTDMLNTPAYKKAVKWIHDHKKNDGRIF